MSNIVQRARQGQRTAGGSMWPGLSIDQMVSIFSQFSYGGLGYGPTLVQTIQNNREQIQNDFAGFIYGTYKTNGAVFAVMMVRMMLFSEMRFQFRSMNSGRPGKLFGTKALGILEHPWQNGTTGDLCTKAIVDVDLTGNFFATRVPDKVNGGVRIARLRPDWVTILLGSAEDANISAFDPTAELVGYIYTPGGLNSGLPHHTYLPEEVAHFAPIPDPIANYRGMSWIQPILQEIIGDKAMTTHKIAYFENGATPNLVVSMDTGKMSRETFQEWIDTFDNEHNGALNAYKTLYLGQGATANVVGNNLKDLDYKLVQGHGETRIAAAGGVPPVIVGFSEGLAAATYSNYSQACRRMADGTLRPLWRNFAGSMATLIDVPKGADLWYDDRDIPFIQEDEQQEAEIQLTKSQAVNFLVTAGFEPDSIVDVISSNDFSRLVHSGLYSVQLREPGANEPDALGLGEGGEEQPQAALPAAKKQGQLPVAGKRATMSGQQVREVAQALIDSATAAAN